MDPESPAPTSSDSLTYTCRSPHCRTPDIPLTDLESMESILRQLLYAAHPTSIDMLRTRVGVREYADDRLIERTILQFCEMGNSFEKVTEHFESVDVRVDLVAEASVHFDEDTRADRSRPSLSSLLVDCVHSTLTTAFSLIRRTVQIARPAGDNASAFCLHDVQQNRATLAAIGRERDHPKTKGVVPFRIASLWLEVRAGIMSGRIAGEGWTLKERSEPDILRILTEGINLSRGFMMALNRVDEGAHAATMLLCNGRPLSDFLQVYCDSSDSTSFLDSPLLRQLASEIERLNPCQCTPRTSVPLPPPTTSSPLPSASHATPHSSFSSTAHPPIWNSDKPTVLPNPFHSLTRSTPFDYIGTIVQPRCCPPDTCSGRPPIESNYPLVDDALMSLFGWTFKEWLLKGVDVDLLHESLGYCVAERVGSLEVGTAEERRNVLDSLPEILKKEFQRMEFDGGVFVDALRSTFITMKEFLHVINRSRRLCLCDLTNVYPQMLATFSVVKSSFEMTCDQAVLSSADEASLRRLQQRLRADGEQRSWRTPGWEDRVAGFARFVNEPLAALIRPPSSRLAGFDRSLAMVKLLGSTRILQGINSMDLEAEETSLETGQGCLNGAETVMSQCFRYDWDTVAADMGTNARMAADRELYDRRFPVIQDLALYSAAYTIDPTDYLALLNCAALRLKTANSNSPRSTWSQVISDCTMAIHYGPPSYKAYYRRGYALAQLKMWDKAVLDFERALALEPRDVFLQERLRLARRKKL